MQLNEVGRSRGWGRRGIAITSVVAAMSMTISSVAYADQIYNNLDGTIDAAAEVMPLNIGTDGTTTLAVLETGTNKDPDGKNGCNLTGGTTLVVAVTSSLPGVATASLDNSTFTNCGATKTLTVHPLTVGSTTITVSQVSNDTGATFNFAPATFTVNVSAPAPANTAPTVTVQGVTHGGSYPRGSVPTATCSVSDAEDGGSTFGATLSAITGPYASDGIGLQTASCSYRDRGGLTAASSVTYSIVDPSAPVITYTLNPTAADGLAGWYKGTVSLDWTVTESDSPNSLNLTGCADQTITADQVATAYTCSATSAGGSSGPVSVSVKRDGNGPVVSYTSASGTDGNLGWYISPVTATFTGTDGTSGPASQTRTGLSTGDGESVTIPSPAFSDAAGNTTPAGAVSSPAFKIDTVAPSVGEAVLSGTLGNGGWYRSAVTASFTAEDATSGVAGPLTRSVTSSQQGTGIVLASPAFSDVAGNTTAVGAKTATVKVDTLAPNAPTATLSPAPNGEHWNNSDVTVSFSGAGDHGGSGVVSCSSDVPVTVETSGQTVRGTCIDAAGNESAATVVTVKLDRTGPVISDTVTVTGIRGNGDWYTSPVDVTFTATDALSGPASSSKTVTSSGDGSAVGVASPAFTDAADNTTPAGAVTKTYQIDTVAPSVGEAVLSGTLGNGGWYRSAVTATFTASDNTSGVAGENPQTVTSSQQGTGIVLASPAFSDVAGNTTAAGSKSSTPFKVDSVAPSVSLTGGPAAGGSYYFGSVPAAPGCVASDETSGLDGLCSVSAYDTSVGTHTVSATATDRAGNPTKVTRTYTVLNWTMNGFYAPVDKGVHNTVKGGNTVPLKFELFAGTTELTDTALVQFATQKVTCDGSLLQDPVEVTSTSVSGLRYDATGGQFIQNWKTPTLVGSCYRATMTAQDGSAISALFKIK